MFIISSTRNICTSANTNTYITYNSNHFQNPFCNLILLFHFISDQLPPRSMDILLSIHLLHIHLLSSPQIHLKKKKILSGFLSLCLLKILPPIRPSQPL